MKCLSKNAFSSLVFIFIVLGLSLSGCVSMIPPERPIPLPVPNTYSNLPTATSATNASSIHWEKYFTDPFLHKLLAQAIANNKDLQIAVLRVREAQAAYGIERANSFPSIDASFSASRSELPADLSVTGKGVTKNQFQVGAGISSWEIDLWGRISALKEAALQSYLATDAAHSAVTIGLVAQVANAYLTLREFDERLRLARRTVENREESVHIFKSRMKLGSTSKLELTQVELLALQAKTLVIQLEQERAAQLHALALLVGAPIDLSLTLSSQASLDDAIIARELAPGVPSDLLIQRPDIVAAEHALKSANANIGVARAAFFPRISLTAFFGTASADLDGLFNDGSRTWSFSPNLLQPIFNHGRLKASLDLATIRKEESIVRYEQTIQSAFRDVLDALSAQKWLTEQVKVVRDTLRLSYERSRLAKLRYDSGAVRYLEVLDAERDRLAIEQQLVQVRRAQLSAQVALYAALGGGVGGGSGTATATK